MENIQDIYRLADKFKYFHNAEETAVGLIMRVHDALYIFVSSDMLISAAFVALSYFIIKLQYQRAILWFFYLIFVTIMIHPIQVDNPEGGGTTRVSAALWYFSKLTTNLVKLGENAIDYGLGRKGNEVGNFATATASLTVIAKSYTPDKTRFQKAYFDYLNQCTIVQSDANNKAIEAQLLDVFYPDRGKLGRNWKANFGVGQRNTYPPKTLELTELPSDLQRALAKVSLVDKPIEGYLLESYDGMMRFFEGKTDDIQYLENPNLDKTGYYRGGESSGNANDDQSVRLGFHPTNCYEMFQVVDLGWRQILRAAAVNAKQKAAFWAGPIENISSAGDLVLDKIDDFRGNQACVNSLPELTAYFNAYMHHKNDGDSYRAGGPGSTGNSVFTKIVKEIEEWGVSIAALFIPAAAALAMAGVFIIYPIVIGTSLIPGREATTGTLLLTIVFIKLSVFFSYAIISAGGHITTATICSMAYTREYVDGAATLTSGYRGIAAAGLVLTYLGGIGGGIWLAKIFTFNDRASVASMGLDRFGAKQLLTAALSVASVAGATKTVAGATTSVVKRTVSDQRIGRPPVAAPPTHGSHVGGKAVTAKDLKARIDNMKVP